MRKRPAGPGSMCAVSGRYLHLRIARIRRRPGPVYSHSAFSVLPVSIDSMQITKSVNSETKG